jgi:hypothetical protein
MSRELTIKARHDHGERRYDVSIRIDIGEAERAWGEEQALRWALNELDEVREEIAGRLVRLVPAEPKPPSIDEAVRIADAHRARLHLAGADDEHPEETLASRGCGSSCADPAVAFAVRREEPVR